MNIVTKSCLSFDLGSRVVKKISDLNYASASHSTIAWKN